MIGARKASGKFTVRAGEGVNCGYNVYFSSMDNTVVSPVRLNESTQHSLRDGLVRFKETT